MRSNIYRWSLPGATAAVVTTAAFSKTFLPFYLVGSTAILALTCAFGVILVAVSWRQFCDSASRVTDILVVLGLLYGAVIISYLSGSFPEVPVTYLFGILIFHALFMIFGFAAALAPRVILMLLLGAATIYSIVIAQYAVQFGDLMRDGYLHDVFRVGDMTVAITFHQNIGTVLGLAALAALGLATNRIGRILAIGTLPLVLLFTFHIAARGAMVALVCSLLFLAGAGFWVRSKKLALVGFIAVIVAATVASGLFYRRALQDQDIDAVAPDAISRTIREIQDPRPGFRMQIWARAWHRISTEPDRLLFGRGIGMYPVNEGFGAPDWLLHPTEGSRHYPHSVYLEMLHEMGIIGLLLFSVLTFSPLIVSLRRWGRFSREERSIMSLYVFMLASSAISGAFAYSYMLQFFLALTVGTIALNRAGDPVVHRLDESGEEPNRTLSTRVRI
jgi:O-antigen ligase